MKLLFAILLCTLPVSWDLFIGRIYWKKKTVVMHTITAAVRGLIVIVLSYFNNSVFHLWQSALLSVAFHYFVFPILYNRIIVLRPWDYISESKDAAWFDKAEGWLRSKISTLAVITLKIMLLATAIKFYVSVCIQWDCIN